MSSIRLHLTSTVERFVKSIAAGVAAKGRPNCRPNLDCGFATERASTTQLFARSHGDLVDLRDAKKRSLVPKSNLIALG
jgi:hypothetical protein